MDLLRREHLSELAEHSGEPCVSIFVPLMRGGPEKKQNRIRLKNTFREVENRLSETDMRPGEIREFLDPAAELLEELPYWKQDSDGLAVFLAPELFRYYRLPSKMQELVVVSDQFHLKPLLPLLTGDGRFYVLALSQNAVRLLQCTHHSLRELDLKGAPTSLADILQYEADTETLQFHTGVPAQGHPGKGAVFHSQADDADGAVHKKKVRDFINQVENAVQDLLADERAPLVLAGVEEIRAIYAEANRYPGLLDRGVDGNPDRAKSQELQEQAWEIVRPEFERTKEEAVGACLRFAEGERGSTDLNEVLKAAGSGRVEVLLTDLDRHEWGRYDPSSGYVHLHYREETGDEDLLDWAAVHTLRHGGTVFALPTEQMPNGWEVAAVFRY
ncbi:MAG: hypothetical protein R6V05_10775 [Candidatus Brocadiia bacterium]